MYTICIEENDNGKKRIRSVTRGITKDDYEHIENFLDPVNKKAGFLSKNKEGEFRLVNNIDSFVKYGLVALLAVITNELITNFLT